MATADLKLVYGGGGGFRPSFYSGILSIAAGGSGTLLTITPPVGKRARLNMLHMGVAAAEASISITADADPVVTTLSLGGALTTNGSFVVGVYGGGNQPNSPLEYVDANSSIVIAKTVGSTSNTIYYSFSYGD